MVRDQFLEPIRKQMLLLGPWLALLFLGLAVTHNLAAEPRVTIAPETTGVVEPLRDDGYVDYVTLLNERGCKGVSPEDNVVVGLVEIIGPDSFNAQLRPQYYELLGIDPLPEDGKYFVDFPAWLPANLRGEEKQAAENEYFGFLGEPRTTHNCPHLVAWLKDNQAPLDALAQIVKRPDYFSPLVADGEDGGLWETMGGVNYTFRLRPLAIALGTRAVLRASEGDFEAAASDLNTVHLLGRQLARGPFLIDHIWGLGMDITIFEYEVELLNANELSIDQAARLRQTLQKLSPLPPLAEAYETGERYFMLDGLAKIARGGPAQLESLRESFFAERSLRISAKADRRLFRAADWDLLFRRSLERHDAFCAALRLEAGPARQAALEKLDAENAERLARFTNPQQLFWYASLTPPGEFAAEYLLQEISLAASGMGANLPAAEVMARTRIDVLQTAAALAQYRADEGEYPESLADLTPHLLSEAPLDRFTQQPLLYERTESGYRLYSVGINGVDDGGVEKLPNGEGGDLVIEIDHGE